MAYAYSDESKKTSKVHLWTLSHDSLPELKLLTSSSCSSPSSSISLEEPYDIDKFDVNRSPEANEPDLIEPPAPVTAPEASQQPTVWSTGSSSSQTPQIPRPPGYDPNRLPATMFAPKPSSAMDWSVASNESLFSINVGNSSFSKDQFSMCNKSGELSKLDEMFLNVPTPLSPVTESQETKPSFNALVETLEIDHYNDEIVETKIESSEEKNVEIAIRHVEKEETKETVRLPTVEETKGSVNSNPSDHGSNHSNHSFNFPVLAGHHDRHDHHHHVEHPLEEVKQETPMRKQDRPEAGSPKGCLPSKTTQNSGWFTWLSCFSACCWICR